MTGICLARWKIASAMGDNGIGRQRVADMCGDNAHIDVAEREGASRDER